MLVALRQRNFALLWFGQVISALGDWILIIALPYYVYSITGSALATGAMFIAETVPRLLISSIAGVFVDRWERKKVMLIADLSRAALLLLLLTLHSQSQLWVVYVVACMEAILTQFFNVAQNALIPQLVQEEHLADANSMNSLADESTRIFGPILGGTMLGFSGLGLVVFADSFSFVISAITLLLIALPPATLPEQSAQEAGSFKAKMWREWLEGFRQIQKSALVASIFAIVGITMLSEGIGRVLLVPFMKDIVGGGAVAFGWSVMVQGIGGVIGSLLMGRFSKAVQPVRLLMLSAFAIGVLNVSRTMFPLLPVVLILNTLAGIPVVFLYVSIYTILQKSVQKEYHGRIFGFYNMVNTVLLVAGMGLSSLLTSKSGIIPLLYLAGGFYFVAGTVALLMEVRYKGNLKASS